MNVQGIVLQQVIFFATVLIIGFAATSTGLLSSESVDHIQKFMMKIIVPLLIITSIANGGTREELFEVWPFVFLMFFMFFLAIGIGFLSGKMLGLKREELGVLS